MSSFSVSAFSFDADDSEVEASVEASDKTSVDASVETSSEAADVASAVSVDSVVSPLLRATPSTSSFLIPVITFPSKVAFT